MVSAAGGGAMRNPTPRRLRLAQEQCNRPRESASCRSRRGRWSNVFGSAPWTKTSRGAGWNMLLYHKKPQPNQSPHGRSQHNPNLVRFPTFAPPLAYLSGTCTTSAIVSNFPSSHSTSLGRALSLYLMSGRSCAKKFQRATTELQFLANSALSASSSLP